MTPLFSRRPPLPEAYHEAWWAFLDCAEVIEGGRRVLLSTLPTGRVEPAPIAVGIQALDNALSDAGDWMDGWRVDELEEVWRECRQALREAGGGLDRLAEVAASTDELEELLEAVDEVVTPLDAFADAERAWRDRWRVPTGRRDVR